jgi:predicted TPR repeat methyltransferase
MILDGPSAPLLTCLAAAQLRIGGFGMAGEAIEAALVLDAACPGAADLARLCRLIRAAQSGASPLTTPGADPDRVFKTALLLLDGAAETAAAARVAEAWADHSPDDLEARHLRDAARATPTPRAPPALVARHFDEIAEVFDARLAKLGYEGPARVAGLIAGRLPARRSLNILDLGCGTGLVGPVLRPHARRLVGVDLSEGMLARARARTVYHELRHEDALATLAGPERWDLVVAADVFPYLGPLEGLFDAVRAALKPNGGFVFSVEACEGEGARLLTNGRYAHGRAYVTRLAQAGFEIVARTPAILRREAGRPVDGDYVLLRRTA